MFFTVKSTKKAIATLIRAAEENRIAVEIRTNGDTETIYFDGKMVAERWSYYAGVILEIEAPCDRPFPEVGTPDYEALVKFQEQRTPSKPADRAFTSSLRGATIGMDP